MIYNLQDEINHGEVQAGAFSDLDLKKVTQTLSLNFTVPQDNPILSSIVFVASVKKVDYKNLLNSSDDFNAQLITFEGTLNF